MASIFTKIINHEIPAEIVYEDDKHIAFLDINPFAEGHTLVVPKKEVDDLFDLSEDDYLELLKACRNLAPKIKKAVNSKRVGILVIGFDVPHAHVHLIPINDAADMLGRNKQAASPEELKEVGDKIRNVLNG